MKLTTGVDLIEIERIENTINRHKDRFMGRVYTPRELEQVGGNTHSLAARFAAKEAVGKALGCGIGDVMWQEIEILRDELHAPVLYLHGEAGLLAENLGLHTWSISLSHNKTHAIAFVVAMGD